MKRIRLYRKRKLALWSFVKDAYAYRRFRADRQFWACLSPIFDSSKSTGCDYSELLTIYNHIRRARPHAILELGSGVSTVVIAYAIKTLESEGYRCRFVSMEENEFYHDHLRSIFPADLLHLVELIQSPVVDRPIPGGYTARCYRDKPQIAYDFVFIDGPQVPKAGGYFDGDILDAIEWNPQPFIAFLDERIVTRKALRQLLPYARIRANKGFARFFIPTLAARAAG